MTSARIAIIHDWLDTWGGGENVLAEMLAMYPHADLYTLVDFLSDDNRERLGGKHASTSFLQRIPGARTHFRKLLPLFPRAIESFDLRAYDIVLSSSHAVAKGVRSTPAQLHICYCYTPMRYAWDLREDYLQAHGATSGLRGTIARSVLDRLRDWDRASSARVTHFVAISNFVRERIARAYGRDAQVIHPPVDTDFFMPASIGDPAPSYYLAASRHVPYKRIDLIVAAFRALPDRRLIVAGSGPETSRIRAAAGANVEFVGNVSRERLRALLQHARAFVFAAEEDFGILPLEAQACGTPVIALRRGGAVETVRGMNEVAGATGMFFDEQSAAAIVVAINAFEAHPDTIDAQDSRTHALRFSTHDFRARYSAFVNASWDAFVAGRR